MNTSKSQFLSLLVHAATRNFFAMFPGMAQTSPKHQHWFDFGYPVDITFEQFYTMFKRNGVARAGVCRPVEKTWQDNPWLLEREEVHTETTLEKEVRLAFDRLQFWGKLQEADKRSRVGIYGGLILRFADSKAFHEPVDTVPGGLDGLVELIPFYQGQLKVSEWDTDERSKTYGEPKMFSFTESSSTIGSNVNRKFDVHPDRVHLWTPDGTVHGESALEAGYNHLVDIEKVLGAGGEGFWKNAKSAPVLEVDKEANIANLVNMLGAKDQSEIAEKLDEVVGDWQKGFDHVLTLQGIAAKTLPITLPSPEHFLKGPLEAFAASIPIPMKILLGSQTGERASTEDAREWEQGIMARREQLAIPNIKRLVDKLVRFRVLPDKDWFVDWSDLTEASMDEKIARADKMAGINQKLLGTGERAFTVDEIREAVDKEPSDELGLDLPDDLEDEGQERNKLARKNNVVAINSQPGRIRFLVHAKAA